MIGRLLIMLSVCAAVCSPLRAIAGGSEDAVTPPAASTAAPAAGAVSQTQTDAVIIESEPLEPTREEMAKRFREKLTAPPSFLGSERRLDSGAVEVTTPVGRFCFRPLSDPLQSTLGGSIMLFAPCTSF